MVTEFPVSLSNPAQAGVLFKDRMSDYSKNYILEAIVARMTPHPCFSIADATSSWVF